MRQSIDVLLRSIRPSAPGWDYQQAYRERQEQERIAELEYLQWPCSHCGAPATQPCTTGTGATKRAHAVRKLPAQEQEARSLTREAVVEAARVNADLKRAERELQDVRKATRAQQVELQAGRRELRELQGCLDDAAMQLLQRARGILATADGVEAAAVMVDLAREIRLQKRQLPESPRKSSPITMDLP